MSTAEDDAEAEITYGIGQVSARLGIPASTLRWWEKCGLVAPGVRQAGRRRYHEGDVRRLALIQLWQDSAMMSLDEIRAFLGGSAGDPDWRTAVGGRIAACEEQVTRLESALGTLRHLLTCPSDHPAEQCPFLGAVLDEYLETGTMPRITDVR